MCGLGAHIAFFHGLDMASFYARRRLFFELLKLSKDTIKNSRWHNHNVTCIEGIIKIRYTKIIIKRSLYI